MIKLEFKIPNLAKRFKAMQPDIVMVLAASMQANRAMMFDKDGGDNGKPRWKPINSAFRSGRPLQNTGTLRKSLAPQNDGLKPGHGKDGVVRISGKEVTIGTQLLYAHMMNDGTVNMPGGVLKVKRAQALKIPVASGALMFRKSVKIPARPMDTITDQDMAEWTKAMENFISSELNG